MGPPSSLVQQGCIELALTLHVSLLFAPSWRTVVGVTHEAVTALLQFLVQHIQHQIRQQRREYSPYAKDNFSLDRVICDWRRGVTVLDLRLKK